MMPQAIDIIVSPEGAATVTTKSFAGSTCHDARSFARRHFFRSASFHSRRSPIALTERLSELVRACVVGIRIESHEHEDAMIKIGRLCREQSWRQVAWDVDQGLVLFGPEHLVETGTNDPLAAFRSLVRECGLTADTLWKQKSQLLKKSGLLSLYRGGEDFRNRAA